MKVFVDTNVLVDIVCTREPFYENAKHIFTLAYEGHIDMVLSSLSYINAYYIGCRYKYSSDALIQALTSISEMSQISPLSSEEIKESLNMGWKDMEDAAQYKSAENYFCNCIVTRNKEDFSLSMLPVYTPEEFLAEFQDLIPHTPSYKR